MLEPYVGPRAFRREESHKFFARDDESLDLSETWRTNRLTILYGPPASGKTSLLQAGVMPHLDPRATEALPLGRLSRSTFAPSAALPDHNPYVLALLTSCSPMEDPTRLAHMTLPDFFRRRRAYRDPGPRPAVTLLAIDQAEELFAESTRRDPHREWFIDQLAQALSENPHLRLLLSIRDEYLDAIAPYEPRLTGTHAHKFPLEPLDVNGAIQAVAGPLNDTGKAFDAGLARDLVEELRKIAVNNGCGRETGYEAKLVEPVHLQVICSALWRSLPDDRRMITARDLEAFAGADRALAEFCDQVIGDVAMIQLDGDAAKLKDWIRKTFVMDGRRRTVRQGRGTTAGVQNSVMRSLADKHILSIRLDPHGDVRWCELSHDRLIQPMRANFHASLPVADRFGPVDHLHAAEQALSYSDLPASAKHARKVLAHRGGDLEIAGAATTLLGDVFHAQHRFDEAIAHYQAAASLFEALGDPTRVGMLFTAIGRIRLLQGQPSAAVEELNTAISRVPHNPSVRVELAWALWYDGHPRTALHVLNDVLGREGNAAGALRARGEIHASLGLMTEALNDLDRLRPLQSPSARAARALALAALNRLDEASAEIDGSLRDAADHAPFYLYAAVVKEAVGDAASAAGLAQRALDASSLPLPLHLRERAGQLTKTR
ncbi:tetratricopeptide repeat protein [Planotetraspora thailandica]|uniref:tetratricopeptide repeat protein n=1 Tax=Planotetraspora thailandica TaxID=487172 RepID=UPI0019529B93|nr:tetratricopeptide repeat protein [Planotetraspora thailandica]